MAKFIEFESPGKGKGKGKDKSKAAAVEPNMCYNFGEGKGCKYGDACKFKDDRMTARKQKRCLACGVEGHFRPECPLVPAELRQVKPPDSPPKAEGWSKGSRST